MVIVAAATTAASKSQIVFVVCKQLLLVVVRPGLDPTRPGGGRVRPLAPLTLTRRCYTRSLVTKHKSTQQEGWTERRRSNTVPCPGGTTATAAAAVLVVK